MREKEDDWIIHIVNDEYRENFKYINKKNQEV